MAEKLSRIMRRLTGIHRHEWEVFKEPFDPCSGWRVDRCACGELRKIGPVPFGWDYNP